MDTIAAPTDNILDLLRSKKYLNVTSFRRDGRTVSTPVEFVLKDDAIYVRARKGSGKIRRIRANPNVKVAPCNVRGKVIGPSSEGKATLFEDDGTLYSLFSKKYGFFWRLGTKISRSTRQPLKIILKKGGAE